MNRLKISRSGGAPLAIAAALAIGAPLTGCDFDEMLKVPDPAVVTEDAYENPSALPGIIAGAIRDFNVSYSGAGGSQTEGLLTNVANFTDEMHNSDTFPTRISTDQRNQFPIPQGNTSDAAYRNLHRARRSLYTAAEVTAKLASPSDQRIARLKALEGIVYIAIGENYCGNTPFSMVEDGEWVFGEPLTTEQTFADAVKQFDAALAIDPNNNLAKVGKARALLNNGQYAEAAAVVADVPTDFIYAVEHSLNTSAQQNPLYGLQMNGRYTMADNEGVNGLPFRSANDPRTPWMRSGFGFDETTPLYISLRNGNAESKLVVASGVEARLIEAEALLQAGNVGGWLDKLNELRQNADALIKNLIGNYDSYASLLSNPDLVLGDDFYYEKDPVLADLADPGTDAARVDLMFSERAFWLYGTAHRLGDLRRMVRQYNRTQDQVFPSGKFFKDGDYGADVAFPVDFNEQNNPNFELEMCDVEKA